MTFEKDFPSLKGKIMYDDVLCKDVEENCLDRKRVEEAKEKLRKEIQWLIQRHIKGEYTIYQIKRKIDEELRKELGL